MVVGRGPYGRLGTVRAVVQRVSEASVEVDGVVVSRVGQGLLALVAVTHGDTADDARTLARKVHGLRILAGERSLADETQAELLAVSQFTLYGDTRRGRRPSWSAAAPGRAAEPVFEAFVAAVAACGTRVRTGVFGAAMRVTLVNEGPMTVLVDVP